MPRFPLLACLVATAAGFFFTGLSISYLWNDQTILKPVTLSFDSTLFLDEHLQQAALQHVRLDLTRDLICGHALKDLTYKAGATQLIYDVANHRA